MATSFNLFTHQFNGVSSLGSYVTVIRKDTGWGGLFM